MVIGPDTDTLLEKTRGFATTSTYEQATGADEMTSLVTRRTNRHDSHSRPDPHALIPAMGSNLTISYPSLRLSSPTSRLHSPRLERMDSVSIPKNLE